MVNWQISLHHLDQIISCTYMPCLDVYTTHNIMAFIHADSMYELMHYPILFFGRYHNIMMLTFTAYVCILLQAFPNTVIDSYNSIVICIHDVPCMGPLIILVYHK